MKNFIMLTDIDGRKMGVALSSIKFWVPDGVVTRVYFEDYNPAATNFRYVQESVEEIAEMIEKATERRTEQSVNLSKNDKFVLIEAEGLSLNDEFMQYNPKKPCERAAKKLISEAITSGVKNFYRPVMDPCFIGNAIDFIANRTPAVSKDYDWWVDNAKAYCPTRNSRLGTRLEYGAFLGVLIKQLIKEGKSIQWAWNAVCNDSRELGHYWNLRKAKRALETTGSRCICGFYDLANTFKMLAEDVVDEGFWLASGSYVDSSYKAPIARLYRSTDYYKGSYVVVGWIVLS